MAIQIAQAVAFLHSTTPPTVHLDIKPANILVSILVLSLSKKKNELHLNIQVETGTYHVYLADFGVAKVLTRGTIATSKTNSSAKSIGTPGFQPPEQLEAGVITEIADVYALGCVFIELFSSKKIWEGLSALQIMVKVVVERQLPTYSEVPDNIKPVCCMCLQEKSSRASASKVLHSLMVALR